MSGSTGFLSFGRCSFLFPSPTLLCSSCRTVGSYAPHAHGNVRPDNPMALITRAPLYYTAAKHSVLIQSRGAGSIHHLCYMHRHVSFRRPLLSLRGSGAAGSRALSWKARSRVHGQCDAPHPKPEGLCNKNRFGTAPVRARSRSARRIKLPQLRDKRHPDGRFRRSK